MRGPPEAPEGQSPPDHWVASAYLCANKPRRTAGADIYNGTTIDQLIAQKLGQETLLPSMQLAVEDPGANSSNCGEGYSCAYTNSISWSTPTTPLPMELNPQVVFERMFGEGGTAEERASRRQDDRSILDSLRSSLSRLRVGLDPADRLRVDEYADNVREIERRLQIAVKATAARAARDEHSGRRAGVVRRAHQAAVRPARAGAPGRHHARRHAALRPRPDHARLSGERRHGRLPRRLAPRRARQARSSNTPS